MGSTVLETFETGVLLSSHSTFAIGGPARFFKTVRSIQELQATMQFSTKKNIPYFILGKGSNCLFDSKGFDGLVILNKIDFIKEISPGCFHVGAGFSFSYLGVQTARRGWAGLEFASGIPGSVGGAVFMNAGAGGQEVVNVLKGVDYITNEGQVHSYDVKELQFSYRYSSFQQMSGAITGATFILQKDEDARSRQVKLIQHRTRTQPYGDHSAGCVFRNPKSEGTQECPSAGALIDRCGLKGVKVGGVMVSDVHANFLVNIGGATQEEVLTLIELVKERVKKMTGVDLQEEIKVIPYTYKLSYV